MNNRPLLSICIPTYNREKYLRECLDSIISQDGFNEEDVEIVISDNASSDNTTQLVQDYQKNHSNIKYIRNTENIGAIRNICNLPNHANGEYIWFLSDDDLVSHIGIAEMIQIIKSNHPDFILSQFVGFWNGETINREKINTEGRIISIHGMKNFFQFLGETQYDITSYMMLLSIFCFKKELYLNHIDRLVETHGGGYQDILYKDNFVHSNIIYLPFGEDKTINIIEKDLVLCRGNNISRNFSFKVCRDLKDLIINLKKQYNIPLKTYRKMMSAYYYSIFSYIVMNHIKKLLPDGVYNYCISIGRKVVQYLKKSKNI